MPRMIELHTTGTHEAFWVNSEHIVDVGIENGYTTIYCDDQTARHVSETPSEVVDMIEQGDRDLVDAVKELTEAVKNDKRVYNCDVHLNQ